MAHTNFTRLTNFETKDGLASGSALKRVKGVELEDEFDRVKTAVDVKSDLNSPAFTGTPTVPTATVGTATTQVASTAFVSTAINSIPEVTAAVVNELAYPVGSIYTSISSTDPSTLLGVGTWVRFAQGRTLVGQDSGQSEFDTVEETGGSKTHQLTEAEMPSHTHSYTKAPVVTKDVDMFQYMVPMADPNVTDNTGSAGGDQAHNNLQPYITVYFWKRTA